MNNHERLYAVRGAVCCENTRESVSERVVGLYRDILDRNSISEEQIVSVLFSVTDDLTVLNPATALRTAALALSTPLFACAEPVIEGYLPKVVRVLVTYYGVRTPVPVYLHGAEALRPDLCSSPAGIRPI